MRKYLFFIVLLLVSWMTAMAVPAVPGYYDVRQSDGTTLTIRMVGDEWFDATVTSDGLTVNKGKDGDYYYVTTSGLTNVKAHNPEHRNSAETSFVNANKSTMTVMALRNNDTKLAAMHNMQAMGLGLKARCIPVRGTVKVPIILVQFKDKKMSNTKEQIEAQYNRAVQYFVDQSGGVFTPEFFVAGIYTLSQNRAYYGEDELDENFNIITKDVGQDPSGKSGRAIMAREAIDLAKNDVKWSDFNQFGSDSYVDICIVVYAGVGEHIARGVYDTLWPCRWSLSGAGVQVPTYDNVKIDQFAIFNEVSGKYDSNITIDGIGTFCHEFSHCLGLPDMYDTHTGDAETGMDTWSVMASGCYKNKVSSDYPIGYTAFEKFYMGWLNPTDPEEGSLYTLAPLNESNQALRLKALCNYSSTYECWFVENRQKQQEWDNYLPNTGVLITHYIYNSGDWSSNCVNNFTDNSLRMEEATVVAKGYGNGTSANEFTSTSNPAMVANLNADGSKASSPIPINHPLTDIKVNNGIATMRYMKNSRSLTVNPETISINAKKGETKTATFEVTGHNLLEDAILTLDDPSGMFTISTNRISKSGIESGETVTVSFTGNQKGHYNASINVVSGALNSTLQLKATVSDGECADAFGHYLDIAQYASIDQAGANVEGMQSIYNYTEYADCAWLTVSNYGAIKADASQEWFTIDGDNNESGSWAATDVFSGSSHYFGNETPRYAFWTDKCQTFYVTNCTQVKQFAYHINSYTHNVMEMKIYECTINNDGTLNEAAEPVQTKTSTTSGNEVTASDNLDPSKIYKITIMNRYSRLYEIGFQTPLTGSTPVLPASLTASPATLNFNVMEEESVSDTINVTGENLTGDVTVTLTDENHAFSIGTTSITKAEAEVGAKVVVTFNPQEAGSYTGTVTLASGNLTQTVALNGEAEAKPQVNEPELTTNPASLSFSTYAGYEVTNTLAVSGQWISDDVVVTCQGEGFYVSTDTIAASNLAEGSVEVAVTFSPQEAGSYTGTVTLTSGSITQTVALNGEATYNVQTPHAIAATEIAQRSFVANWNADSCLGATSYTLRVIHEMFKLVPKPSNTTTLLLSEDFNNCNSSNDEITDANTDNSGWSGIRVYVDNSAVRVGGSSTGTLYSPDLDLSNSNGKVSVRFLAKTYSKPGNYQYQSENNPLKISCNGEYQTITVPSTTYEEFTVVLPCEKAVGQKITFANTKAKANVIIDSVRIYAGDITVASLPAGFDTGHNGTLPGSVGSGLGSGFSSGFEVVVVRDTTIYTGITENHYKLTGLAPMNNYNYDVKAVYGNQESGWSNSVGVITKKKFTPLDDLVVNGRVGHEFVINDDLIVVHVKGSDGLMWCKSVNNTSVDATEIRSGQVDYMRDVVGEQISEWDQSNWILLQFPADDGTNGIKDMLEDAVGKIIPGGSVAGIYTDEVNYSMAVLPVDNAYTLELGDEVSYTKNLYCTANFLPSNLNINGGNGALGHIGGNDVYYFFMNPKVQEVCEITAAEFDADGVFVNPFSNGQVSGSIKVDWSYNAEGVQSPEKGKVYSFMAVVNRELGSDGTYNYIVYPLNFTTSGSAVTGIGSIDGSREAVSVEYVNTAGLVSDKPFKGVNIVVTRYSDGSKKVTKELYK